MLNRAAALLALAAMLASVSPARASEHLVSPGERDARLSAARTERARDIAALDRVLSTPAGQKAAATLGADPSRLRRAVSSLSDAELRDLSARAAALDLDPMAGYHDLDHLLYLVIIVVLIVVLIKAVS